MDLDKRETFIKRRSSRYMGQTLRQFEELIEPHLPKEAAGNAQAFKGEFRKAISALAQDGVDMVRLDDQEQNGVAVDLRDRLHVQRQGAQPA